MREYIIAFDAPDAVAARQVEAVPGSSLVRSPEARVVVAMRCRRNPLRDLDRATPLSEPPVCRRERTRWLKDLHTARHSRPDGLKLDDPAVLAELARTLPGKPDPLQTALHISAPDRVELFPHDTEKVVFGPPQKQR